ncbi:MAG: xanthine dehydrogenase small subunit [Defluviicoccus sp.]|nr:xanthine dehydrogenase small subunit [Defluviicoccus sp.]
MAGRSIRILLNGELCEIRGVPPATTVLDWLRTEKRLTGTKEGCAEGDCGACTVVLGIPDGAGLRHEAVNSCLITVPQLAGRALVTVEGLAANGRLHPVQQAMVEADASQCGFCTPGIAMALYAFLEGGEEPQDETIHDALAGNLCRCTGYRPIVDAARKAERTPATLPAAPVPEAEPDYEAGAQTFFAPRTLDELLALRAEYPDAPILAGGTDLGLLFSKERRAFDAIVSVARVEELCRLEVRADEIEIGAAVTYTQALPVLDAEYPGMGELIRRIGSRQIRNLGTIGGNIGNASPIGDTLPCLIALDARLMLRGVDGAREMPLEDFFIDYRRTDLRPGEVIEAVRVPRLASDEIFRTYKVSKRYDQDISAVIGAYRLTVGDGRVTDARIAYGGMAATPKRARGAERALIGAAWSESSVAAARRAIADDFEPIDDFRAGAGYRATVAANLLDRLYLETAGGTDAPTGVFAL